MKFITIGNRKYPYFISAAAAKRYFESLDVSNEKDPLNIDKMIAVVHQAIEDASLTRPFWERIIYPVPNKNKLSHMIDLSKARDVLNGLIPSPPVSEPFLEDDKIKKK